MQHVAMEEVFHVRVKEADDGEGDKTGPDRGHELRYPNRRSEETQEQE